MIFAEASPIRWLPPAASTGARHVDHLFFALVWLTAVLSVLIFASIIFFSLRYRRSNKNVNRTLDSRYNVALEIGWTIVPTIVGLGIFVWAANVYLEQTRIPKNALEVYVVGKQWMWKLQHAEGPREINELHVPVGVPVKLLMTSQDVIHSFFVPDFRAKRDVLPGRFQGDWFEATQTGEFHLFCAEYCGTEHSRMKGRIVVLSTNDYQKWLASFSSAEKPALAGKKLFHNFACNGCHGETDSERGPSLVALFGKTVSTRTGVEEVDETYLARSIQFPSDKIANGYGATMPSYKGQISEEQTVALVAYIKSLANERRVRGGEPALVRNDELTSANSRK